MEIKLKFSDTVYAEDPDYPRFFEALQQMLDRMGVSHFKYGTMADSHVKGKVDAAKTGRQRLTMYDGKNAMDSCDCDPDVVAGKVIHHSWCVLVRKGIPADGSGNTENLLDAANCFIIEHLFPRHAKAHFHAQETKDSPGLSTVEEVEA